MKLLKKDIKRLKKYLWWYDITTNNDVKGIPEKKIITSLLNYGTYDDLKVLLNYFPKAALREAVRHPLPGVWDKKSLRFWSVFWNQKSIMPSFRSL